MSEKNSTDDQWIAKLRRENLEQFTTLVRMHLSFILDLNTDESENFNDKTKLKKWSLSSFTRKAKNSNKGIMDGAPLTQEGICQVYQLIEFLNKESNICTEGIFRRTGSYHRQQELRTLLNQGKDLHLENNKYNVHDCATVLKGFLAELPEPLLCESYYSIYSQISDSLSDSPLTRNAEQRLLQAIQLILLLLPTENRVLLKDLLKLLNETTKYEMQNKMSADSLATLFMPHLICPRRLSPQALHNDSKTLVTLIAYMIRQGTKMFEIPPKLAVDAKMYFTTLNSKSPKPATNTVFSFIDKERTAKAHDANTTETALAQLYNYIQTLPESSKKKKFLKQFQQESDPESGVRSKSLSNTLKKHIFNKSNRKSEHFSRRRSSSATNLNISQSESTSEQKENQEKDSADTGTTDTKNSNNVNKQDDQESLPGKINTSDIFNSFQQNTRCYSEPDLSSDTTNKCWTATCLTSTPACLPLSWQFNRDVTFTPRNHGRKSMSPITRSTQKMSRAMQEIIMTPRSRKPVLVSSGSSNSAPQEKLSYQTESLSSPPLEVSSEITTSPFITKSPVDESFSSRTDDYGSYHSNNPSFGEIFSSPKVKGTKRSHSSEIFTTNSFKKIVKSVDPILKPKQYNSNGDVVIFETSF